MRLSLLALLMVLFCRPAFAQSDPWQGVDWRTVSAERVRAILESGEGLWAARTEAAADPDHHLPPDQASAFLLAVCYSSDVAVIEELLWAGAAADDSGPLSPLMYAAQYNSSPSIIDALIVAGAEVRADQGYRVLARPALTYAAQYNDNPAVIAELVALGGEVNKKVSVLDNMGLASLMYAAQHNGNPAVIQTLIKEGAEVNLADSMGRTALVFAAQYNAKSEVLGALIAAGAAVNIIGRDYYNVGFTPLMYAAISESGAAEKLGLLLDAEADARPRSREGKTAFDYAARNPAIPRGSPVLKRLKAVISPDQ